MKILLFGGTTEGREIAAGGLPVYYSVTTGYGAELGSFPNAEPFVGRMDAAAMKEFIVSRPIAGVIDATHPYAVEVTRNIRAACAETGVPYIRVSRGVSEVKGGASVSSCAEAADFLRGFLPGVTGGALLTVGSKELENFSTLPASLKQRLYVRVLPTPQVIGSCERLGFDAGHIIAMKGPFTKDMNMAVLAMTNSRVLVTKDGGAVGGLPEKLAAAEELGVKVLLVGREAEAGMTVAEAMEWGKRILKEANGALSIHQKTMSKGLTPLGKPLFPMFTNIAGQRVIVVGAGKVAARRVKTLLACGALVTVISPSFDNMFDGYEGVERIERPYTRGDLLSAPVLAVAAANDRRVNREIGLEAKSLSIPVSVADAADECTFFFPALVHCGNAAAAVSTGGRSPSLCRRLAARLRRFWPDWVEEMSGKP